MLKVPLFVLLSAGQVAYSNGWLFARQMSDDMICDSLTKGPNKGSDADAAKGGFCAMSTAAIQTLWVSTGTSTPTTRPTASPVGPARTSRPTGFPTASPTAIPTGAPTRIPTQLPTRLPTTAAPTTFPTSTSPTQFPTSPTLFPTSSPTTSFPTRYPTPPPSPLPCLETQTFNGGTFCKVQSDAACCRKNSPSLGHLSCSCSNVNAATCELRCNNAGTYCLGFAVQGTSCLYAITLTSKCHSGCNVRGTSPNDNPKALDESGKATCYSSYGGCYIKRYPVPTTFPTTYPSPFPTAYPSKYPTPPSKYPTRFPTKFPTLPTSFPTASPTNPPTPYPTRFPTLPTEFPTAAPTCAGPTCYLTSWPTPFPTTYPSASPTTQTPTAAPTCAGPTCYPTSSPTPYPTTYPTAPPTASRRWRRQLMAEPARRLQEGGTAPGALTPASSVALAMLATGGECDASYRLYRCNAAVKVASYFTFSGEGLSVAYFKLPAIHASVVTSIATQAGVSQTQVYLTGIVVLASKPASSSSRSRQLQADTGNVRVDYSVSVAGDTVTSSADTKAIADALKMKVSQVKGTVMQSAVNTAAASLPSAQRTTVDAAATNPAPPSVVIANTDPTEHGGGSDGAPVGTIVGGTVGGLVFLGGLVIVMQRRRGGDGRKFERKMSKQDVDDRFSVDMVQEITNPAAEEEQTGAV